MPTSNGKTADAPDDAAAHPSLAAMRQVCSDIRELMRCYREQEASPTGVDTPGGLEHMGDVWATLADWDRTLSGETP